MAYKNPIPSLDDEMVSKQYCICFHFEEDMSADEAMEAVNRLLEKNGGVISKNWLQMGRPAYLRLAEPQY